MVKGMGTHSVKAGTALMQWGLDGQVGIPGAHCAPGSRGQIGAEFLRYARALERRVDPVRRLRNMTLSRLPQMQLNCLMPQSLACPATKHIARV